MMYLIIAIVVVIALYFLGQFVHDKAVKNENEKYLHTLPYINEASEDAWYWSHNTAHFKLKGVNNYPVKEGHHEAYIIAEIGNHYDSEALLVIDRNKKAIGYLPRGNGYLYREITDKYGRYLPVNVVIYSGKDGSDIFYYGYADICLETYPNFDERKMVTGFEKTKR